VSFLLDVHSTTQEIANLYPQNSDYDVFLDPLDNFRKEMEKAGLSQKVVYLDRKDQYKFAVQQGQ
jgi:hypothetical protein